MKRFIFVFSLIALLSSCEKKHQARTPMPAISVEKAMAIKKDTPEFIDAIGHVDPMITIDVRPRVAGEILKIHFKEGEEVKLNDLLFTIDPRPYEAALYKNRAALSENEAHLRQAEEKLARYSSLVQQNYISPLDFHDLETQVVTFQSMIEQNKADIKNQELNIEYCHIFSPIDGMTGILNIDKGNTVFVNNTVPLVTILQIQPIYVLFSVGEKHLDKIRQYQKKERLLVLATTTNFEEQEQKGFLDILDNSVNTNTGMIRLRAIFPNKEKALWPGTYVKTRLIVTTHKDSIVIPFESIQFTQKGPIVFVIKNNNSVESRPVTLGQRLNDEIVIIAGLKEKEEVVTKGALNLYPGASITIPSNQMKDKQ